MEFLMLIPVALAIAFYFWGLIQSLKAKGLQADLDFTKKLANEWLAEKHWLATQCGELSDVNSIAWLDRAAKESH